MLLISVIVFNSCRKTENPLTAAPISFDEAKFFQGTENANSSTKKIVAFLKNKQMANPSFLPILVKRNGYPIWNKSITNTINNGTGRTSNENEQDTIIKVPFAHQNSTEVNAFIEAIISDTLNVGLFEKNKYLQLPKGSINSNSLTAEKYLNEFFFLQNAAFGHSRFKIIDTSLFKSLLPNNNGTVKNISMYESNSIGTAVNSFGVGCYYYKTYYTTVEGTGDNVYVVGHVSYQLRCYQTTVSVLSTTTSSLLGNIDGFTWDNLGNTSGSSINSPGGGTIYTGNPSNNINSNQEISEAVGFFVDEEAVLLINQILTSLPNLTENEIGFLLDHSQQMKEIVNYLNANNNQDAKDKVSLHIGKMISDPSYLIAIQQHAITSNLVTVWWDDIAWYSNSINHNFIHNPLNPFWLIEFPINANDEQVIDNGITISPVDNNIPSASWTNIATIPDRGNTEDLQHGTTADDSWVSGWVRNASTGILFDHMTSLFEACTTFDGSLETVGKSFIQKFKDKTGGTATNQTLNDKVAESGVFKNFVKNFAYKFAQRLKAKNGILIGQTSNPAYDFPFTMPQEQRPVFNSIYHKFHGLQILLNDTEHTTVDLDSYTVDAAGNYKANITVTIHDHFGLDKNDAQTYQGYSYGFPSWWLLQHKHNYIPFKTKIVIKTQIQGNYNSVTL